MLSGAYHWLDTDTGHYLCFNAITVAYVKRDGERYRVTINWRGQTHTGRAGSAAQGKRFIERWIAARPGLPTAVRRLGDELLGGHAATRAIVTTCW